MLKILIIINIFLLSSQLWLSFVWASEGTKISQVLTKSQELASQNQVLREKIYSGSSLTHIYDQAIAMHLSVAAARP